MKYTDYFAFLVDEIHSVIAATVDENGLPVTCAIDIMDWDENGLYFLTAKGKNFYHLPKAAEIHCFDRRERRRYHVQHCAFHWRKGN